MPVDEPFVTRSTVVPDKVDLCRAMLGKVSNRWSHGRSYVGLPEELEDFRLLLDQSFEAKFEWMSFTDANIIYCIPSKVFSNWDMWDVKVSLLVYVVVEMHKSDQGSTMSTSRLGIVGWNPYPSMNNFPQWTGRRRVDKFDRRDNENRHNNSVGGDAVAQQQSTTEDYDGISVAGDKAQWPLLGAGRGDNSSEEEVYRPAPSEPHKNPPHNRCPLLCGTHSPRRDD
ncbi:hypothetical protein GOBAR_AA10217 [Gossypium barbadense]|uniref:Uncharacterized protein n=1 Tax=Gossypium barbadense TaxID=3634 RepID=A0A2P5Y4F5_GOSBA|nr:hypothetical protein GOBAR_AA10217 [Gossypium barbadense]